MSWELVMPKLGLTMETGEITAWLIAPGQAVVEGEPVCEVATDKIEHVVEAPRAGTLREILALEGADLPVGTAIAAFD